MDRVAAIRAFNRFYTRHLGVLSAGMLDTPYSLTEGHPVRARAARRCETGELRRMLGLDAGYLSRILSRFEADGLVTRERSAADARRQIVRLTAPAAPPRRHARRALHGGDPRLSSRCPRGSGGGWSRRCGRSRRSSRAPARPGRTCCGRRGPATSAGWCTGTARSTPTSTGGTRLSSALVARHRERLRRRRGRQGARRAGSPSWTARGRVRRLRAPGRPTAQLRLLLVEPSARGMGIGGRLVDECLRFARTVGYSRIMLMDLRLLADARRIYQRAGFELESETPERVFGGRWCARSGPAACDAGRRRRRGRPGRPRPLAASGAGRRLRPRVRYGGRRGPGPRAGEPAQRRGGPPVGPARQAHRRGHQDRPDHRGVGEHRDRHADAEHLHEDHLRRAVGREGEGEDHARGGDQRGAVAEPGGDGGLGVAGAVGTPP